MDEQRYVVQITRPVAPEKVEQVSQRIAARLNVPQERIFTLLDGRVGDVTKPVLSDKADAICEVFAEAGVRVIVAAARIDPPHYEERFGQAADASQHVEADQPIGEPPLGQNAEDHGEGHGAVYGQDGDYDADAEYEEYDPVADFGTLGGESFGSIHYQPETTESVADELETNEPEVAEPGAPRHDQQHAHVRPTPPARADVAPWDEPTAWGVDAADADSWKRPEHAYGADVPERHEGSDDPVANPQEPPHASEQYEPYEPQEPGATSASDIAEVYVYADEDPEEEADRLGPTPRRLRVTYEEQAEEQGAAQDDVRSGAPHSGSKQYVTSTRWTPSPHDPYAFTPEDSPGYSGRRSTPIGPAHTTPLTGTDPGQLDAPGREGVGGFYSPEYSREPREGPRLRTYLVWALIISLVVLILLQFVLAMRVDGSVAVGAFEAGLAAYRKGDFSAARQVWEPLADAGNPQAQYFLGFMLQNGLGQPWSNARAGNWYRRAAQQGHTKAQLALGDLYFRGMGVEEDRQVGASWYASAAVAGDPDGQFEYAKLLLHGVGVEQDMHAALAWFEAAAANGVEAAADYVEYARAHTH